jgi:uncharacterized FlgJ-related protein
LRDQAERKQVPLTFIRECGNKNKKKIKKQRKFLLSQCGSGKHKFTSANKTNYKKWK